jgi:hypothetical protein
MIEEFRNACRPGTIGGFLPGVKQIENVAALRGIVRKSIGLSDIHLGYGFAIGNCRGNCFKIFIRNIRSMLLSCFFDCRKYGGP